MRNPNKTATNPMVILYSLAGGTIGLLLIMMLILEKGVN
jgi:hypothetical protein